MLKRLLVFWPILLILTLVLIYFHKILLHPDGMIYPAFDVGIYTVWKTLFAASIKTFHELPLWNPYLFSGTPFVGSGQSAMFYPINYLYLLFPVEQVFGYVFIIDFFLLGTFTYVYAREINISKYGSLLTSILMIFGAPITTLIIPAHIFILDGITWFPLMLFSIERLINKKQLIYAILFTITISLTIFSGNVQIAYYSLITILFYFIFRLIEIYRKENNFKNITIFFLIFSFSVATGLLLSSIQLFPSFEFSSLSVRNTGLSYLFSSDFSLHPYHLITLVSPFFFGNPLAANSYWGINGSFWSSNIFLGIVPLLFIFFYSKRGNYFYIFFIICIFSILFSFGRFFVVFPFLYDYLPLIKSFRVPARFLFVFLFSTSILFGLSYDNFVLKVKDKKSNLFNYLVIVLLVTTGAGIIFLLKNTQFISNILSKHGYAIGINRQLIQSFITKDLMYCFVILFIFFIFLILKHKLSKKYLFICVLLLMTFDLFRFSSSFYKVVKPENYFGNNNVVNYLKNKPDIFRVLDFDGSHLFAAGRKNIELTTGYDAMYIKDYRDYLWKTGKHENTPYESFITFKNIENLEILQMLNVGYVISSKKILDEKLFDIKIDNTFIYKIDKMPRAYFVDNKTYLSTKKNIHSLIASKNKIISVATHVVSPNKISLELKSPSDGVIILSEIWFPGWKAYVNSKEQKINKSYEIFRSINIKKGINKISFIYDPISFKIGRSVSIATLLFICWILYFYGYKTFTKTNSKSRT